MTEPREGELAAGLARRVWPSDPGVWGPPPAYHPPAPDDQAALADVYARLESALGPAADTCRACGTCCRFKEGGIVLFASALEMANLVAALGMPRTGTFAAEGPVNSAWCCPFQEGNRCTARAVRPLGCRTYFCDPDAGPKGRGLHADALDEIRCIARAGAYPWWYGPARVYLAAGGRGD
ncbi:MAG TPA: hypothetical protein VM238_18795 [Phycisphaerae bacterium]|nr:hypothetical protein [Phycisphaerae bacterium]